MPVIFAAFAVLGPARADEADWKPAAPLANHLSRNGELVETGVGLDWTSPKAEPAARLGPLLPLPLPRPAPEGAERPKELPETLNEIPWPSLPPYKPRPVVVIPSGELPRRAARETFASESKSLPTLAAVEPKVVESAPDKTVMPAPEPAKPRRPQPWAPRPGQRTLLTEFFGNPSR